MRKGRLRGRNYQKEFGMSRNQLAKRLGITPANLSNRLKNWGNPHYNPKI
jgi:DNA-binding XRE family transcriptional regulator